MARFKKSKHGVEEFEFGTTERQWGDLQGGESWIRDLVRVMASTPLPRGDPPSLKLSYLLRLLFQGNLHSKIFANTPPLNGVVGS